MKRLRNKIEKYIVKNLKKLEGYTEYNYDEYLKEIYSVENKDEIRFLEFELNLLDYKHEEKLYDIKFKVDHKNIVFTFETSNYYFFKGNLEWLEDIYENIDTLLRKFRFLLESYSYFTKEDSSNSDYFEEDEGETIDEVAYNMGFEIDDDGHWNPVDTFHYDYDEHDWFNECLKYDEGVYTYHDSEENGRFYWKDK